MLRSSRNLDASTSDAEIHRLRIECKKLCYLLEFFASLFPREEISQLVKELKKLQNVLGDHHDLSVQQEDLSRHLACIKGRSRLSLLQAAAVGGLIARLNGRQQSLGEEVRHALKSFRKREHTELYQKLFGPA